MRPTAIHHWLGLAGTGLVILVLGVVFLVARPEARPGVLEAQTTSSQQEERQGTVVKPSTTESAASEPSTTINPPAPPTIAPPVPSFPLVSPEEATQDGSGKSPSPDTKAEQSVANSLEEKPSTLPPPVSGSGEVLSTPYELSIPAIKVTAPIVGVGLDEDGAMASPPTPDIVGWFAFGPKPGSRGNVLLDGHLDWTDRKTGIPRTAVFWRLRELEEGDEIYIYEEDTKYTYAVTKSLKFRFDDPLANSVLQPSSVPIITLITCEGPGFDPVTRSYPYRRVVVAELKASS